MDGHYINGKFNWKNTSTFRVANGTNREEAERNLSPLILERRGKVWGFESLTVDNV